MADDRGSLCLILAVSSNAAAPLAATHLRSPPAANTHAKGCYRDFPGSIASLESTVQVRDLIAKRGSMLYAAVGMELPHSRRDSTSIPLTMGWPKHAMVCTTAKPWHMYAMAIQTFA